MTFDEYQKLSAKTAKSSDPLLWRVQHWTIGLTNEAGEVAGVIKKAVCRNDDKAKQTLVTDLRSELGDVLWYLTQLAAEYGLTLADVAEENIAKLKSRHPEKFE